MIGLCRKNNKRVHMGLKLKIILGYAILIALLAVTICLFRREQIKRNTLLRNEKELVHTWQLTEQIYADLLELATEGEMVSVWKQEDYLSYSERRREICDTLRILKSNAHTTGLQGEIDTLCLLLKEKERLLGTVMNTFKRLQSQTDIINERIPSIISKVEDVPDAPEEKSLREEPAWRKNIFPYSAKKRKNPPTCVKRKNRKGKKKKLPLPSPPACSIP